ncbi:hypothetical protein ACFLEY_22880 [Bradyrhizobium sp. YCK136]|uniref:hypothetical protein n=1 Tax=Bradyrhizobium sp. YCK136 TaxID=3351346 RepID=UPI0037CCC01D
MAKTSKRGNADLHAKASALMGQPVVGDWQSLERVVTQLGAAAPRAAKEAVASYQNSMSKMPNPWADRPGSVGEESGETTESSQA